MNKTHHTFILVLTIMTISASVYFYLSQDLNSASAASGLTSSLGTNPSSVVSTVNDKATLDVSFIDKLASLTQINIDTTLFTNTSFDSLKDNTVVLESVTSGRPNPFAPIETQSTNSAPVLPVVTNEPTQVTDKTAFLNGAIRNGLTGITSAYFEYGTTTDLGKITPTSELSLLGTFIKKIVNLTPKTSYYFRSVVKVNGVSIYGDIVSFTTN